MAPTAQTVAQALGGASRSGAGWKAQCPCHGDRTSSLTLADGEDGKLLVKCHAGCDQSSLVDTLKGRGLWPEKPIAEAKVKPRIVATYDYQDIDGTLLFQALRYHPKTFRQRCPDGSGGWSWKVKGVKAVPYRLPELVAAVGAGQPVAVVEGEKDADNLTGLGLAATCNAAGAGKWRPEFAEYFRRADVAIFPDNDEPGRDHAATVAANLALVAARVRVVELPELPPKGDVSDWLAAGGSLARLMTLVEAAPTWTPSAAPSVKADKGNGKAIRIVQADLEKMVDTAEAALIKSGADIFQRGGMLVRPGLCPVTVRTGEVSGLRLIPVSTPTLVEQLTSATPWEKYDGRSDEWVPTRCPDLVADIYANRAGRWRLRVLTGIIEAPTLRPDGSVLDRPGYDEETGLLLRPNVVAPAVKANPNRDDALRALGMLSDLIASFPFVESDIPDWNPDRSVALSAILTAAVRRSLTTAPLHAFTAPVAGSGKSMLVDIASLIATGRPAAVISQGKTEEEFEKRIGSALIAGDALISVDNCEIPLGGELLCQLLTQATLKIRPLGRSTLVEVPSNAAIYATGNNLTLVGDMTRRALVCRLDPQCERPEVRVFTSDPLAVVAGRRGEFIAAALTVLRAYWVAGRPGRLPPLGSFTTWSDTVRSAVVWLGEADPVETMEAVRASDPALDALSATLNAWRAVIGIERVSVGEVIRRATQSQPNAIGRAEFLHPDFREALLTVAGDGGSINSRRLGKWLGRNKDRVVGGMRIVKEPMWEGNVTWRICAQQIN